jgi:hypothetical protein
VVKGIEAVMGEAHKALFLSVHHSTTPTAN